MEFINFYIQCHTYKDEESMEPIDIGTVTIANYNLFYDNYYKDNLYYLNPKELPDTVPFFGAESRWRFAGNQCFSIPKIDTVLYLPKLINIIEPSYIITNIKRTSELKLSWNIDTNYNGKVAIIISYSNFPVTRNPNLLFEDMYWHILIPDSGSYTISNKVLMNFPKGENITLEMGRGIEKVIT